jgi:hypothetical protein
MNRPILSASPTQTDYTSTEFFAPAPIRLDIRAQGIAWAIQSMLNSGSMMMGRDCTWDDISDIIAQGIRDAERASFRRGQEVMRDRIVENTPAGELRRQFLRIKLQEPL